MVGFEPTYIGATTRGLNHLPTPTILATKIRLELTTSSATGWHSNQLNYLATRFASLKSVGGSYRARTCDPLLVRQMLSQLS